MIPNNFQILSLATITLHLFITSCSPPTVVKRNFTYCYDEQPTGLDSLLMLRGYYQESQIMYNRYGVLDTFSSNFLLYHDGICVYNFVPPNRSLRVKEYIEEKALIPDDIGVVGFMSGSYRLYGDTIKMQLINHLQFGNLPPWVAIEKWYLIRNKTTLIFLGQRSLEDHILKNVIPPRSESSFLPAKFHEVDTMPRSQTWLKEKKWFRCE